MSEDMSKLYSVFPWVENPFTFEGRKRFEETLKVMGRIVEHVWVKNLVAGKTRISILDLCAGYGIGSIALLKVIKDRFGVDGEITAIDLRHEALEGAKRFAREELSVDIGTLVLDVTKRLDLGRKFDIVLLWGLTTPHFSPWSYIRVLANIHKILHEDGVYIYDEADRRYGFIFRGRYRDIAVEAVEENRIVLTIHKDYDPRTGYDRRAIYDIVRRLRAEINTYYWGLAESAAFTWMFFEDVDYIPLNTPWSGVIIARAPRKTMDPTPYLEVQPTLLNNK